MQSTKPLEGSPMIHQIQSPSPIQDQSLSRVEDNAQLNSKNDFDSLDWVCSSRSSTCSAEASELSQPVDQSVDCLLSQVSGTPWQRQSVDGFVHRSGLNSLASGLHSLRLVLNAPRGQDDSRTLGNEMTTDIGVLIGCADSDGNWGIEAEGLADEGVEIGHLVD